MVKGKKKTAAKASSSAVKKHSKKIPIAVHRGNAPLKKSSKGKTKKGTTQHSLPAGGPITSVPPILSGNQVLRPGNILHKCSGSDIKLSKNSDTRPNFTIGRGRFLFVLPGLLSLRKPNGKPHNKPQSNTNEIGGENDSSASSVSKLFTMGKVRNLETDKPILEMPLPSGQMLSFQGQKIKTASRYLALTCKTSGAVNCRHTFQEMIVFSDHTVTGDDTKTSSDEKCVTEEKKDDGSEDTQVFNHYGGSERALDGDRLIRGLKRSKSTGTSTKTVLSFSQESSDKIPATNVKHLNDSGSEACNKQDSESINNVKQNKRTIHLDDSSVSDDSDEETFKSNTSLIKEALPPRKRSSRSSATKKVSYTFDDSDNENDDDEEGSDDSGAAEGKTKDDEDGNDVEESSENEVIVEEKSKPLTGPKRARRKGAEAIDLTGDGECKSSADKSSALVSTTKEARPTRKRSTRSRTSGAGAKFSVDGKVNDQRNASDEESVSLGTKSDENKDYESSESKVIIEEKSKPPVKRKGGRRSNTKAIDLVEKDSENRTATTPSTPTHPRNETSNAALKNEVKKEKASSKRRSSASKPSAKSRPLTTVRSPSYRKRRKVASPSKKTPFSPTGSQMGLKMDGDDEFIFIE